MEKIASEVVNSTGDNVLSVGLSAITVVLLFVGNWFLIMFKKDIKELYITTKASDIELAKHGENIKTLEKGVQEVKDKCERRGHEDRQPRSDNTAL